MKLDTANGNVVSMFSDFVLINVDINNVDLTLFNVVSYNVDLHNVTSMLF